LPVGNGRADLFSGVQGGEELCRAHLTQQTFACRVGAAHPGEKKRIVFAMEAEVRCRDSALGRVRDRTLYFVHHIHTQLRALVPPW
jgi:hypothetical protein